MLYLSYRLFVLSLFSTFALANLPPTITWGGNAHLLREMAAEVLGVVAADPENAPLTYTWTIESDPTGKAKLFDTSGNSTKFGITQASPGTTSAVSVLDGKVIVVRCDISDGVNTVNTKWIVTVQGYNRPPILNIEGGSLGTPSNRLSTGQAITPKVESVDPDGEAISIQWFYGAATGGRLCGALTGSGLDTSEPTITIPEMTGDVDQILRVESVDGMHLITKEAAAYLKQDSTPCSSENTGGNRAPSVTITASKLNPSFQETVELTANATDPDPGDRITSISWTHNGGTTVQLATTVGSKVTFQVKSTEKRRVTFTATAFDSSNTSGSGTLDVLLNNESGLTVPGQDTPVGNCTGNSPPTVSVTLDKQSYKPGDKVTVTATGQDPDGSECPPLKKGVAFTWELLEDSKNLGITLDNASGPQTSFHVPANISKSSILIGMTARDGCLCGFLRQISIPVDLQNTAQFSIAVGSPTTRSVSRGSFTTFSLTLQSLNGFAGRVNLGPTGFSGGSITFPNREIDLPANGTKTATADVIVSSTAELREHKFKFTGTSSGTVKESDEVTVKVEEVGNIELKATELSAVTSRGGSVVFTLTLTSVNGFSSSVNLSPSFPSGSVGSVTFSAPNPVILTANQKQTISATITVANNAAFADHQLEFTATSATKSTKVTVVIRVQELNVLVFPNALSGGNTFFGNDPVGIALFNPNGSVNQITLSGRDKDGVEKANLQLEKPLDSLAQVAFVATDKFGTGDGIVSVLAKGSNGPIQGFFIAFDGVSRWDGVSGDLKEAKTLYLPIAKQTDTETTILFIFNGTEQRDSNVQFILFDQNGLQQRPPVVKEIPPQGALIGSLTSIFGLDVKLTDGYVKVVGTVNLKGFEFYGNSGRYAAIGAQTGVSTDSVQTQKTLYAPHIFVDSMGGSEIRLLNAGGGKTSVTLKAVDDKGNPLGEPQKVNIEKGQVFTSDIAKLLKIDTLSTKTGYLTADFSGELNPLGFPVAATLVGSVSFGAKNAVGGETMSTLPLIAEGLKETLFLQVAENEALFTGLAILNAQASGVANVTVEVFDGAGKSAAKQTFKIEPGKRAVGLLSTFFPSFRQIGGHFRVVSDIPVISFALFGDNKLNFLSAIEGQKPIK